MSKKLIALAMFALFLSASAFAQMTPTSKMEGRVTDSSGAPLPGVSVTATSPKMVGKSVGVTDEDGKYRLFSLPSGIYEITFALQGFKTLIRKDIVVQLSQTVTLNVQLDQAALEEQVTVVGQSPLIDVKSTVKSQTMTKEVFMSLPRTRNFDGLLSTVPGVQYESNTGGLSVDGATGTENMWYMDGTDITQVHVGTRAQGAVMEMVEEVKVTASGYNAEFGGSMGGVVNVITRSGGNAFHGDLMAYYNDNSRMMQGLSRDYLRWNPYDDLLMEYVNDDDLYYDHGWARDPYYRLEGVFSLGGYILKDKLWFFGAFNPSYSNQSGERYFLEDPAPQVYYPYNRRDVGLSGQFKMTAAPAKGLRLSASYVNNFSEFRGSLPSRDGTSGKTYFDPAVDDTLLIPYNQDGFTYPNQSLAFLADYSMSNNFLMSLRLGWAGQDQTNQGLKNTFTTWYNSYGNTIYASDPFFVANPDMVHARYWGSFPYWQETNKYNMQKYSGNLDLTYYASMGGEHAFKAGAQAVRDQEDVDIKANYPRVNLYWGRTCSALAPYGVPAFTGTYGYYQVRSSWTSPYGWFWNVKRDAYALYLQDSWTIGGKLTLNVGVRAEQEYIPSFNADYPGTPIDFKFGDKLAPRLGVVYDVFGDSSLKIFGTYGMYYDVIKLYIAEGTYGGMKWKTDYYMLNNPNFYDIGASNLIDDRASQEAGGTYMGTIDFRVPSFDTTDPNLKPVAQQEISLGAEKRLSEDLSVSLRLINKHLIRTIEDVGVVVPGGEQYFIGNPGFGWTLPISEGGQFSDDYWPTPKAKRDYYGVNISLEKRFSHNWQGGINYTWSQNKGNYGGLSSTDEGGRNSPNVERSYDFWYMSYDLEGNVANGILPQNRTHYIKAYGSYVFPFGLTVGLVGYGRSGFPMSTQLAVNNAYMYVEGRGDLGDLPFTLWADIYLEYAFKIGGNKTLAFNLQCNNVTNTKTWSAMDVGPTRQTMYISDEEILSGTYDWQANLEENFPNEMYKMYTNRFGTWSTRLGFRFSF